MVKGTYLYHCWYSFGEKNFLKNSNMEEVRRTRGMTFGVFVKSSLEENYKS